MAADASPAPRRSHKRRAGLLPPKPDKAPTSSAAPSSSTPEPPSALTATEARALRPLLVAALTSLWEYADEGLTLSNKRKQTANIWQTIDDEETGVLVDSLLERARVNPVAARVVRGMAEGWRQVQVGIILAPRFYRTWRFYADNGIGF